MLKVLIWCLTVLGLLPAAFLCLLAVTVFLGQHRFETRINPQPPGSSSTGVAHLHDAYVSIGSLRMRWYPRKWAVAAIGLGILLVVLGLVFVLHVATS